MSNSMFRLQSSTVSPLEREITLCLHGQVSRLPFVDARHHPINKQKGARPTTACNYCNTSGNSGQKNCNAFVNLKIIQQIKTTLCIFTRSWNIVLYLFVGMKQWRCFWTQQDMGGRCSQREKLQERFSQHAFLAPAKLLIRQWNSTANILPTQWNYPTNEPPLKSSGKEESCYIANSNGLVKFRDFYFTSHI